MTRNFLIAVVVVAILMAAASCVCAQAQPNSVEASPFAKAAPGPSGPVGPNQQSQPATGPASQATPAPTPNPAPALAPPALDAKWLIGLLGDDRVSGQLRENIRAYVGLDPKGSVGVPESTDITGLDQKLDDLVSNVETLTTYARFTFVLGCLILVAIVVFGIYVRRFILSFDAAMTEPDDTDTPPPAAPAAPGTGSAPTGSGAAAILLAIGLGVALLLCGTSAQAASGEEPSPWANQIVSGAVAAGIVKGDLGVDDPKNTIRPHDPQTREEGFALASRTYTKAMEDSGAYTDDQIRILTEKLVQSGALTDPVAATPATPTNPPATGAPVPTPAPQPNTAPAAPAAPGAAAPTAPTQSNILGTMTQFVIGGILLLLAFATRKHWMKELQPIRESANMARFLPPNNGH